MNCSDLTLPENKKDQKYYLNNVRKISETNNIPILMYHEVVAEDEYNFNAKRIKNPYILTVHQFEAQINFLHKNCYSTISLNTLVSVLKGDQNIFLPDKPIILTFDDGFENIYLNVLPILIRYNFLATFFVIINKIDHEMMMSWKQIEELYNYGMSVQSHTMNHQLMKGLNYNEILYELSESKKKLQDYLQCSIDFLSIPHGSYNKFYKDIAKKLGYLGGCTSNIGFVNNSSDPFLLPRIVVNSKYQMKDFIKIVQMNPIFYIKLILIKETKNMLKRILSEKKYNNLFKNLAGTKNNI